MQTEVFMIEFWQKISGILMRHRHFTNYRAICIDTMGKKSLFFLMSMIRPCRKLILDECGLSEKKEQVKYWYDGFIFGECKDIYNPWSILNYLDKKDFRTYWANTSSNSLVGKLLREGNRTIKEKFENLLCGETIRTPIDEQIVYNQLDNNESAIWSLLLASGYLKVLSFEQEESLEYGEEAKYELVLTNYEVERMFNTMVRGWLKCVEPDYNDFIKALLLGDKKAMNAYMNRVALSTF